jgi:2-polyprenyl-3-methyl-5-hydroxy-6-metoxy-1,4-benzoquinol methylase
VHEATQPTNLYWAPVDPSAPNNAHAYALEMIGANKRVLELGPAAGAFTRALADQGCRVVAIEVDPEAANGVEPFAERVVVGDLSAPGVVAGAIDDEGFDVVVGGDVLEHLPDPLEVLRACRAALKPGGYVVLSLPNVAHVDVKLQLLDGRFPYRATGLLDRTHLRFFTRSSAHELFDSTGYVVDTFFPVVAMGNARFPRSSRVVARVIGDLSYMAFAFRARAR